MTRTLTTLTDAYRQRRDVGWLRLAKLVLWRDRYGASPQSLTLYVSDRTHYLPVFGGGIREYLGLVQQWGTVGDSLEADKPETAPSSVDLVLSDQVPISAGAVAVDHFSALIREGLNSTRYDPGGAEVTIAWIPPTGQVDHDEVVIFVGTADAPDPMTDSQTVTLKCTSDEATASIPLEATVGGPGGGVYVWLIHESQEVEVHDGDVEFLCSVLQSGSGGVANVLGAIAGSAALDFQLEHTFIGAQPASEGGSISRQDTLYIYVRSGFVSSLTAILSSFTTVNNTGASLDFNAFTFPPTLNDVLLDPCTQLTSLSGGFLIGTLTDPTPGTFAFPGIDVDAPIVVRIRTSSHTGVTLNVFQQVAAMLSSIAFG